MEHPQTRRLAAIMFTDIVGFSHRMGTNGLHSLVARRVQAPVYAATPALSCVYYTHWSGLRVEGSELYLPPRRAIVMLPTNEELALLAISWPTEEFHRVRADIEGQYWQALADCEWHQHTAVRPMYEFTCQLAALEPPSPDTLQLYAALHGNRRAIDRFFGTIAGTVAIGEFFAPEHLQHMFNTASG